MWRNIQLQRTFGGRFRQSQCATLSTISSSVGKYNHLKVEEKWQKYWEDNNTFVAKRRPGHEKKYILDMFPYPSG
jgi:valyl-tRNA synthetase